MSFITNIGFNNKFIPTNLTGCTCTVWFDGKDPAGTGTAPAVGSAVTTWADKSGNGYNATSPSATKATYSSGGGLLFVAGNYNGTNSYGSGTYYSSSYTAAPTNETVFIVYNLTDATNQFFFTGLQSGGRSVSLYNSSPQVFAIGVVGVSWGAVYGSLQMAARTTYLGVAITSGGTNTYAGVNGTLSLTGPTAIGGYTAGTTTVIGAALGNQLFTNGYIYEIIAYNSVLNTTQRQTVETYLAQKWGFTASLPLAHPGYKVNKVPLLSLTPYYTAFLPTSIPGCTTWLDGADPNATGIQPAAGAITSWKDKSSTGTHFTGTGTYGLDTTFNKYGVLFNGGQGFNQVNTSKYSVTGGTYCIFSVFKFSGTTPYGTVYRRYGYPGVSGPWLRSGGSGGNQINFYVDDPYQTGYIYAPQTSGISCVNVTSNAATGNCYINGSLVGSGPRTPSYTNFAFVVGNDNSGYYYLTGTVFEFIVYNTYLTTTQQQTIESYLAQKWGITTQLDVTHLNTTKPAGLPVTTTTAPVSFLSFISKFMSTYYNLSGAYALVNIANSVSANSATPIYVWTVAVPSGAKGKNGILALFFNMYSSGFTVGQTFDYAVYVDGVSQLLSDTGTLHYVQSTASTYALSSNGISMGTNGILPLLIPMAFASSASQIQIGLKNSSAGFTPVNSALPGYTSNIITSSGTINTSGYLPQTLFTTGGSNYYTVPTNTSAGVPTGVYIYLWGCGGATTHMSGGGGGFVSGYYSCSPGTNLIYVVGSTAGTAVYYGGGGSALNQQGGGFSGVFLSNAGGIVQSNAIAIAGGGGAGVLFPNGTRGSGWGGYPNGGAVEINSSGTFSYSSTVTGGTQTSGGLGPTAGNNGTALSGGAVTDGGGRAGGGGGGWYGGGGNGGSGEPGAGGSGYIGNVNGATGGIGLTASAAYANGTDLPIGQFLSGNSVIYTRYPGGISSPYYPTPYGQANSSNPTGAVVIIPAIGTSATQIGVSASLYSG